MEGFLLVPPDRGIVIGRAIWKNRYVVLGPAEPQTVQDPVSRRGSSNKLQSFSKLEPKDSLRGEPDQVWLSIYKHQDDNDAIVQYRVSALKSCEILDVQHRKPGPCIPTLVVAFRPDPASDKLRKRRSSRTPLHSACSNGTTHSIMFRSKPDERNTIHDWHLALQTIAASNEQPRASTSPKPTTASFSAMGNSFASKSSSAGKQAPARPPRPDVQQRSSPQAVSLSQTPKGSATTLIASPSPSLRSRWSDLSSPASSVNRPAGSSGALPNHFATDLPSPALTLPPDEQFISGWTSAQGRSSALSSYTRGSASASLAGTPPAPRETILDRAFMMNYIPGPERAVTSDGDDEKMSSLAKFEALMREAEERRKSRRDVSKEVRKDSGTEEEVEGDDDSEDPEDSDDDLNHLGSRQPGIDDDVVPNGMMSLSVHEIPQPAQRALEYISGRPAPLHSQSARPARPLPARSSTAPPLPSQGGRALHHSANLVRTRTDVVPSPSSSSVKLAESDSIPSSTAYLNNNSAKRLSFTEFARRLSSTSSLLLVPTNASSGSPQNSKRNSLEAGSGFGSGLDDPNRQLHRGLSNSRLSALGNASSRSGIVSPSTSEKEKDNACNKWRVSGFGAFGGEGGFL